MRHLKKQVLCETKFYEDHFFYYFSYKLENRSKVFLKRNFYFSDVSINHDNICIAKIDKGKIKDFMKLFKPFESSITNSVTSDYIGKLFKNSDQTDKETLKSIEILLQESLKSLGIEYINEYACAVGMVPILLGFSKYNMANDFKNEIYSLEKYMRVKGLSKICDAI
jgi:hypothetical protein